MKKLTTVILLYIILLPLPQNALSVRIKDISTIEGGRQNYLVGFGIVAGLRGTGDTLFPALTVQSILNFLQRMGIRPDPTSLKSFGFIMPRYFRPRDAASCIVTAKLPPFAKPGIKIDVTVSATGDARSLRGGSLVMTPLFGPDGKVWALAQGQVITGGEQIADSPSILKNGFPTSGIIPSGAVVEKEIPVLLNDKDRIRIFLDIADFSTAKSIQDAINDAAGIEIAFVEDQRTISVIIPNEYRGRVAEFISVIEGLEIFPDSVAKVFIDERTGTVVMGENVSISEVAVSHGELLVQIKKEPSPLFPFETAQEKQKTHLMPPATTVGELVNTLNKIGASPRDVISILQAIKKAGGLHAQLETN